MENIPDLIRVAEHPGTYPAVLEYLAQHAHAEVRIAVADNPRTSKQLLWQLAVDESADVRYAIAENHNCPAEILETLLDDWNAYISYRAKRTLDRLNGGRIHKYEFESQSTSDKASHAS